jgi:hypothetical protein
MGLKKLLSALAVAMLVCAAFAKDQNSDTGTRAVEGIVTGPDSHPVTGAVVQLNDTRTLQIRSFITAEDGKYHFAGLSTNDNYELHAQFNGASSGQRRLDVFNPRKVAKIDLKLRKK